jgi:translation initiation factor 2 subunit 1
MVFSGRDNNYGSLSRLEGGVSISQKELPEVGELVIATVDRITQYGAYVKLDEYEGMDGLLHISEVSSGWVRNVRDYVREKEKVVLKVLRVDPEKRHIDLSLRRVSGKERQDKLLEWKRGKKVESILEIAAANLKLDPKSFSREVTAKLEEKFENAYAGLEELLEKGEDFAEKLKIPKDWAAALREVARQRIKLPTVKIKGVLQLACPEARGVEVIKNVLLGCRSKKAKKAKVNVDIYTLGAPNYAVEVVARNYKEAEKTLQEVVECALSEIRRQGGQGTFKRTS